MSEHVSFVRDISFVILDEHVGVWFSLTVSFLRLTLLNAAESELL